MSHEITELDTVLSVEGTEWHGLAKHLPAIGREEMQCHGLLFPLVESVKAEYTLEDGRTHDGGGDKAIFADLPANMEHPGKLVHLSNMGADYHKISNERILETLDRSFAGICDYTISTAGTLEGLKKFFISVSIKGHEEMTWNGDRILTYLNFITSHDGTLACQAYDSNIRIVCMNTLRWSLDAAGAVGFKVKHTKNAGDQFENMEKFIQSILTGRDEIKEAMEMLANESCTLERAENFAKGYLAKTNRVKVGMELSTRSKNAAVELVDKFTSGAGNHGRTLYDLLNAGTEYWTSGDGTGKGEAMTKARKMVASEFGSAADHKNQWFKHLATKQGRDELCKIGKGFALLS